MAHSHLLARHDPERALYLAVPDFSWRGIFAEEVGQVLIEDNTIRVFSFDPKQEKILEGTPLIPGAQQ
jgi:hypothetical protein